MSGDTEDERQENDLWDELAVDVQGALEVSVVEEAHDDSKEHLTHAENDGHLHLE